MKKIQLEQLMAEYKNLEKQSHVTIDDVLNKVNQEGAELLEAYQNNDIDEMHGEACDVAINILSVAVELWIDIYDIDTSDGDDEKDGLWLVIQQGAWNQKIQALRWRYSRDNIDTGNVQETTQKLLAAVLDYTVFDLGEIIQKNTDKFRWRQWKYVADINLREHIVSHMDFPKKWIDFKDISSILNSPELLRYTCMELAKQCQDSDVIVWLDSRGFLFWPLVAQYLRKPFVMARKAGKIPWDTIQKSYGLEYGKDTLEMQSGSIESGQKVSIIDDLLATWGTAGAAVDLVEDLGGEVNNISFVISLDEDELAQLDSRKNLSQYNVNNIVSY